MDQDLAGGLAQFAEGLALQVRRPGEERGERVQGLARLAEREQGLDQGAELGPVLERRRTLLQPMEDLQLLRDGDGGRQGGIQLHPARGRPPALLQRPR